MSSSALEAAEKLKLLLLDMRNACQVSEAKENEAIVEREQRSMAKEARFNDLFRDLKYIEEGIDDIKANQLMVDTGAVSPESVEEIMRIVEVGRQAQVAHVIALMEECSERRKQQNIEIFRARQRGRAEPT